MSGSETLPALETACLEGGTTGSSLHAMTEAVSALPTSHLWLVGPFHGQRFVEGGREHRLRSVPKLCQSVPIVIKGAGSQPRVTGSAKNSDGSRKEPMARSSPSGVESGMAIFGKTIYYLGFFCGQMIVESSTPLISAFLTTS